MTYAVIVFCNRALLSVYGAQPIALMIAWVVWCWGEEVGVPIGPLWTITQLDPTKFQSWKIYLVMRDIWLRFCPSQYFSNLLTHLEMLAQGQVPHFQVGRRDGNWLLTIHGRIKREHRVIERNKEKYNIKWIFLTLKVDYNNMLCILKP